ncbi:hypothetical protein NGM10_04585 [Halorussus salilacus]|uniref:hypothetical protein n=1 Tax=Halorussus salilacus TaxID=2953750 RepID=UPI00209F8AC7|nr:hypothetical protein [Halorussus salilacus]USZ69017.1 hypothetical protein NGM10_04585 [Halorussus salilacus]
MIRYALRAAVRGVGVVGLTAVEATALSVWLGLALDAPSVSVAAGIGVAALVAGLLVEGLLRHLTVNGWRHEIPAPSVAGVALVETGLWLGWFSTVRGTDDPASAAVVGLALAVGLVPVHAATDDLLQGRNPVASLVGRTPVGLAVLEAAGATAWFLLVTGSVAVPEWVGALPFEGFTPGAAVGGAVLVAALFVQHVLAIRYALRATRATATPAWRSSRGVGPE